MRRNLIHLTLALVLVPSTVAIVLDLMIEAPSVLAFPKPTHRVAIAVDEAMRAELASVVSGEGEFSAHSDFRWPDGSAPVMDETQIPEDYPALWLLAPLRIADSRPSFRKTANEIVSGIPLPRYAWFKSGVPMLWTLNEIEFDGRGRDGLAVKITVRIDTIGQGSVVDFHGNTRLTRLLSGRIADRLAHPRHKHESPEDRAALMAFFGRATTAENPAASKVDPAVQQTAGP